MLKCYGWAKDNHTIWGVSYIHEGRKSWSNTIPWHHIMKNCLAPPTCLAQAESPPPTAEPPPPQPMTNTRSWELPMTANCCHVQQRYDGKPFPFARDLSCMIDDENYVEVTNGEEFGNWGQSLDSRIFHGNKVGWKQGWQTMLRLRDEFKWTKMATTGGYCGATAECRRCGRTVGMSWNKNSTDFERAHARAAWLSFFGGSYAIPGAASQPMR